MLLQEVMVMADKVCSKINDCYKITMILDHDLLDFQYAEAIREVCDKCEDNDDNSNK